MRTIHPLSASPLLLLWVVATVSCTVNSQPPWHSEPAVLPALEVQDVTVVRTASSTELLGSPGAVGGQGGSLVRAFAIDVPGVSTETDVGSDSTFQASLASPGIQTVHLEVESWSGAVVGPWNFETKSDGTLEPLPSSHCLSNNAGPILFDFIPAANEAANFTVKLTETCGERQDIHVALHSGTSFRLKDAPTSIGAHETVSLSIVHAAMDSVGEDVDLLVVTDSDLGAMVVSLHVAP
jgi:hypothetical protein